ncbi:MAG: tyrosine-type recombinase/integrase [Verrucomicrobiae bacterium]|nr:tyrosine-type recombinase/integrase [Verrucomicrobiae bacterium]
MREMLAEIGDEADMPTVRDYLSRFIEEKKGTCSPNTIPSYQVAVDKFMDHIGGKSDRMLDELTRTDLLSFRDAQAKVRSPATVNLCLRVLRMAFRAAREQGLLVDPALELVKGVPKEKADSKLPAFKVEEIRAILSVADNEWKSLIVFGLYTGQRLGDLARLCWRNVDLEKGEIRLTTKKTGRSVVVPMAAPLKEHVMKLPSSDSGDTPLHSRAFARVSKEGKVSSLSREFGELLAQAGFRTAQTHEGDGKGRASRHDLKGLSFHSLRRSTVSLLHEAGVSAAVAQEIVGHDNEAVHRSYIRVGEDALKGGVATLPDITTEPKADEKERPSAE